MGVPERRPSGAKNYLVGYGKPPVEHQFKKGQSGNPGGRPRGSKNKPPVDTSFGSRAAEEMLKAEAYRVVSLREDGKPVELPMIQAVFRSMGVSALKGNRLAAKNFAELIQSVEESDFQSRLSYFEAMGNYQNKWREEIEYCKRHGLPEPSPVPHPDDIVLKLNEGRVQILGPRTQDERDRYDILIARRDEAQQIVSECAKAYRRARSQASKDRWLEEWHFEQGLFDRVNDNLGPRYQARLVDRSYHEGASSAGDFKWRG